jgi:hypothetical protein
MNGLLSLAIAGYFLMMAILLFLYFRPKFVKEPFVHEGFTTVAIDNESMPKCLARDTEAQRLLTSFHRMGTQHSEEYEELKLILQKALCLDADVTGPASGPYSTYTLPFATSHDIEPIASFVGRCVRKVIRERDIVMLIETFRSRGAVLIARLCNSNVHQHLFAFHAILDRVQRNITPVCVAPKATLDIPAGPRDPGYYESEAIQNLTPYTISGGRGQYF